MKVCPKCKNEHDKSGTYCSRSCANSRSWSDEDKQRKSSANKGRYFGGGGGERKPHTEETKKKLADKSWQNTLERFERGEITERATLRKVVAHHKGYHCEECKISTWNDKPITLQVDHIDGDAGNNIISNLRLVCPNCHSQSDTFGGRNKGKGRKSRGLSLK